MPYTYGFFINIYFWGGIRLIWIISLLSIFLPILSIPLVFVGLYLDNKNYKFYSLLLVFNIAIIGYYSIVPETHDLTRHYLELHSLIGKSLKEVLDQSITDPLIIKNIWFYLISKTGNFDLLPFTAIILTYYFLLRDTYYLGKKEFMTKGVLFIIAIFLITWYPLERPLSGVRYYVAITLFIHGLYREYVEGKRNLVTYSLYVMPLLLHYGIIILFLIRLFLAFSKKINVYFYIIILFWGIFSTIAIDILSNTNIIYISQVAEKAKRYMIYKRDDTLEFIIIIIKILITIIFAGSVFIIKEKYFEFYYKYKKIYDFGLIVSLFIIGGANIYILPDRYFYIILYLLPLILIPMLKFSNNILIKQYFVLFWIAFMVIGAYYQYVKFKDLKFDITFVEIISKNFISLLLGNY